jgi:hypothetical protein
MYLVLNRNLQLLEFAKMKDWQVDARNPSKSFLLTISRNA